jgi:hypothetical protein
MAYEITRTKVPVVYETGGHRLVTALGLPLMDCDTKALVALLLLLGAGFWLVNAAYKEKEELLRQQLGR